MHILNSILILAAASTLLACGPNDQTFDQPGGERADEMGQSLRERLESLPFSYDYALAVDVEVATSQSVGLGLTFLAEGGLLTENGLASLSLSGSTHAQVVITRDELIDFIGPIVQTHGLETFEFTLSISLFDSDGEAIDSIELSPLTSNRLEQLDTTLNGTASIRFFPRPEVGDTSLAGCCKERPSEEQPFYNNGEGFESCKQTNFWMDATRNVLAEEDLIWWDLGC